MQDTLGELEVELLDICDAVHSDVPHPQRYKFPLEVAVAMPFFLPNGILTNQHHFVRRQLLRCT